MAILAEFPAIPAEFVAILAEFPAILAEFVAILAEFPAIPAEFPAIPADFPSFDADLTATLAALLAVSGGNGRLFIGRQRRSRSAGDQGSKGQRHPEAEGRYEFLHDSCSVSPPIHSFDRRSSGKV